MNFITLSALALIYGWVTLQACSCSWTTKLQVWRFSGWLRDSSRAKIHSCKHHCLPVNRPFPQLRSKNWLPQGMLLWQWIFSWAMLTAQEVTIHTKFEIFLAYCWFYKNPIIKLAVDEKLGMVTSWAISIAHKIFVATATCLEGVNFLTASVERVYSLIHLYYVAVIGRKLTLLCFYLA